MKTLYVGTRRPGPTRLAWRTEPGELGPGWLGMVGRADKAWSSRAAKFNINKTRHYKFTKHVYTHKNHNTLRMTKTIHTTTPATIH